MRFSPYGSFCAVLGSRRAIASRSSLKLSLIHIYRADATLCAILAAAFAGFLIFNYHPARIFMGDCGSLPAGFALGALTLAGPVSHKGGLPVGFFYPALTFAYPIFDRCV